MSEVPEETGDERVDAIVAGLGGLSERPVSEHVAVFDEAFSGLESALAAVDETAVDETAAETAAGAAASETAAGRGTAAGAMAHGPRPGGWLAADRGPRPGEGAAGHQAVGRR